MQGETNENLKITRKLPLYEALPFSVDAGPWPLDKWFRYIDSNDPQIDLDRKNIIAAHTIFLDKWKERADICESEQLVFDLLNDYQQLETDYGSYGKPYEYFFLASMMESGNQDILRKKEEQRVFGYQLQNKLVWIQKMIGSLPKEHLEELLNSPLLASFHYWIKRCQERQNRISKGEEQIVFSPPTVSDRLTEHVEFDGKAFPLYQLLSGNEKEVEFFYDEIEKRGIVEQAADELSFLCKSRQTLDKKYHHQNADGERCVMEDIPFQIVENMIAIITTNYHLPNNFFTFKSIILGKELTIGNKYELDKKNDRFVPLSEGTLIVNMALQNFHPITAKIFQDAMQNGEIDFYPRIGKTKGSFCAYMRRSSPTPIRIGYQNKYSNVVSLGHESGHKINYELTKLKQSELYYDFSTITSETISIFFQQLVEEEILNNTIDEKERFQIKLQQLQTNIHYVFHHATMYKIEQELHNLYRKKQEKFTSKEIEAIYYTYMSDYYGKSVMFKECFRSQWILNGHLWLNFYSSAFPIGMALSNELFMCYKEKKITRGDIIEHLLSAGNSSSPRDIFLKLGIDIAKPDIYDNLMITMKMQYDNVLELYSKILNQ